ncbi:MAG TPA: hypothetical protein VI198_01750 [Candidatus Eisenbacteria bacterium]
MSFASKSYGIFAAFAAALLLSAAPASAQSPGLKSPKDVSGFYTNALRNAFGNATGNFSFIVWKGDTSEADPSWGGYRVRRTIFGVSSNRLETIGQWKARSIQGPVCWDLILAGNTNVSPTCPGTPFQFTGTGLFFHGFQQNRRPDGSYVLDYPPGAPVDTCSNCWLFFDGGSLAGFRHEYAVTAIDTTVIVNSDFYETAVDSSEIVTLMPGSATRENLEDIAVVPNPYKVRAEWEPGDGSRLLRFIRVPDKATVRIFTSNGELIRELVANQFASPGGETGDVPWDLKNADGRTVVSGIYLYQVEMTDGRTRKGKFVIIK